MSIIQDKSFKTSATISFQKFCKHQNGCYIYPTFLFFKKKYFVCSDCGELIPKSKWYLN